MSKTDAGAPPDTLPAAERLDFVTVVFESELHLLRLQARSMALYLDPGITGRLVVIDNSARGMRRRDRSLLLAEYGQLADRVSLVRPEEVCELPLSVGWRRQQILKLAVAPMLSTRLYVVLDAKNHFVKSAHRSFFVSPEGKPRVNYYSYLSHPLKSDLHRVLTYCGLDAERYIPTFSATVTPFVLERAAVMGMISDIESESGRAFADVFEEHELLEFFLYAGWLVRKGVDLDDAFDFHQVFSPTVWPKGVGASALQRAVDESRQGASPVFSVHRRALGRLPADSTGELEKFWVATGMFPDVPTAHAFIGAFRSAFVRSEIMRKIRESRNAAVMAVRNRLRRTRQQLTGSPDITAGP